MSQIKTACLGVSRLFVHLAATRCTRTAVLLHPLVLVAAPGQVARPVGCDKARIVVLASTTHPRLLSGLLLLLLVVVMVVVLLVATLVVEAASACTLATDLLLLLVLLLPPMCCCCWAYRVSCGAAHSAVGSRPSSHAAVLGTLPDSKLISSCESAAAPALLRSCVSTPGRQRMSIMQSRQTQQVAP